MMRISNVKLTNMLMAITYIITFMIVFTANAKEVSEESDTLAQAVTIKAREDDNFLLAGDYYLGDEKNGGVIVLHDCDTDRRRYKEIAERLAKQGLHTLLLDFRGYGESIAEGFSRDQIKKNAVNIVSYQSEMALLTTYWQDDLLAAYHFLQNNMAENRGTSIVASGCSGAFAVALAEKIRLSSMVLITAKMGYSDKERYKNLIDIPSYFITSSHHHESYQTAQELFAWNGDKNSKIQIFKGDNYAYQLILRKKYLSEDIANWIKLTVDK